jgi:Na+-transporting methylmalonyl-CoA/oxaloacetate decarboxylase gamma subunit
MGMMGMGFMMVLGIAAVIIISLVLIAAVSQVAGSRFNHEPLSDAAEKPKRDRLILSDDGELLEIVDSDWKGDEKSIERKLHDTADNGILSDESTVE